MDPDGRVRGAHAMRHLRDVEIQHVAEHDRGTLVRRQLSERLDQAAELRRRRGLRVGRRPDPSVARPGAPRSPAGTPSGRSTPPGRGSFPFSRSLVRTLPPWLPPRCRAVHRCRRRAFGTPRSPLRGTTRRSRAPHWCARPPAGPPRSPARRTIEGLRSLGRLPGSSSSQGPSDTTRLPDFPGVLPLDSCRLRRPWTEYRIGQAAELLGVSADTVRRLATTTDGSRPARTDGGQQYMGGAALAKFAAESRSRRLSRARS